MLFNEKKIIIVEDDPACVFVYKEILDLRYKTKFLTTLEELKTELNNQEEPAHLIIIDLNLPDGNFLNWIALEENQIFINSPFIIVSSADDIDTLRHSFSEGAQDYLIKPFKKNELIVKLEKMLKNEGQQPFNSETHIRFEQKDLTLKELMIMSLFNSSKNNSISREQIIKKIWGEITVHPKTLDVHLYNLRKKIAPQGLAIQSTRDGNFNLMIAHQSKSK